MHTLAQGQQQLAQLMAHLIGNKNVVCNNRTNMEGSGNRNPHPPNTRETNRRSHRPLLPQFTNNQAATNEEPVQPNRLLDSYFWEYAAVEENTRDAMTFNEYSNLRFGNRPRGQPNFDLICKVSKLSLPSFDRSFKCTTRAWVQKLDTYFRLNPMIEVGAIQFATLHLEGEAHEWWYHGLVTLGHANITFYEDFTQRLIERFD